MTQRIYTWFENKAFFDKLPKRVSSAALALVDSEEHVLVVKATYKEHWTFPGGIVDPGETPLQAAIRETSEEVGVQVMSDDASFVMVIDRMSKHAQSYQFVFQAEFPEWLRGHIALEAAEIEEYEFVSKAQIIAGDRFYAASVLRWAEGKAGYIEQFIDVAATHSA
jgi:8-oxo-dGTP pyrophosphatase MutT (NUDIX family)